MCLICDSIVLFVRGGSRDSLDGGGGGGGEGSIMEPK